MQHGDGGTNRAWIGASGAAVTAPALQPAVTRLLDELQPLREVDGDRVAVPLPNDGMSEIARESVDIRRRVEQSHAFPSGTVTSLGKSATGRGTAESTSLAAYHSIRTRHSQAVSFLTFEPFSVPQVGERKTTSPLGPRRLGCYAHGFRATRKPLLLPPYCIGM